jgi:hypothetical protein
VPVALETCLGRKKIRFGLSSGVRINIGVGLDTNTIGGYLLDIRMQPCHLVLVVGIKVQDISTLRTHPRHRVFRTQE